MSVRCGHPEAAHGTIDNEDGSRRWVCEWCEDLRRLRERMEGRKTMSECRHPTPGGDDGD